MTPSVLTRPGRRNPPEPAVPASWLKHWKDLPLATAFALTSTVGGLFLLIFFFQIGGMPELDLAGVSAVLLAVAVVGVLLAVVLTACASSIGLILRSSGESTPAMAITLPKILLMRALPSCLTVLVFAVMSAWDADLQWRGWYGWPLFGLTALWACWTASRVAKIPVARRMDWLLGAHTRAWLVASCFAWSCVWAFVVLLSVMTFVALAPHDGVAWFRLLCLVVWTWWCSATNFVVATAKGSVVAVVFVACVLSLVLLLSVTGNWIGLPAAVVRALGLGEVPVVLVITAEGCDQLNQAAGGRPLCRVAPSETTAVVCPVMLRSRIGSPFFIEVSAYDPTGHWPQAHPPTRLASIAIDRKEVRAWSRLAPMRAASAPPTGATDTVVTYLDGAPAGSWLAEQCGAVRPTRTEAAGIRGD